MLKSANYTEMKQLQSFENVAAMNEAIRGFLYTYKHELTPAAINVLKTVSRYACKIVGVAFLKVDTIAKLTESSKRTVQRALKTLESYGVIERKATMREKGGSGHNVYVIRTVEGAVTPDVTAEMSSREESKNVDVSSVEQPNVSSETVIAKTSPSKRINKRINVKDVQLDESYTPSNVPQEFVEATAPFYRSADVIYRLWNRVLIAYKKSAVNRPVEEAEVLSDVIQAFKESVFAKKASKIRTTFEGYFYRIVEAKLAVWKRRENPLFDWLANE
ncbi:helix-turn-helix domain-containing protein [Priestia megaterium]|uniref:helix-turn-helix domain-containing protein n=1 Tax=Priestia megaterium TaxID=1404 RepID=UPI00257079CD|nr:helix-turn-helix domain-containing protein [Priestia megaterium]WJD81350.1 helix-turn-helix domain-containing protein [Priestia megaterium]